MILLCLSLFDYLLDGSLENFLEANRLSLGCCFRQLACFLAGSAISPDYKQNVCTM